MALFALNRLFISVLLTLSGRYALEEKKLRMVQLLYRHGDRSPTTTFPSDVNIKLWPQGLGQLTQKGMRQEYHLGEFLKSRYITNKQLLDPSYIRNQVYCRSTDVDRTIMSAQTQLNGLYPPQGRQVWREGAKWQPIPVHVESNKNDKILQYFSNCPKFRELYGQSFNEPRYQQMKKKYQKFIEQLSPLVGHYLTDNHGRNESLSFGNVYSVYDNLFCSQSHNFSLPSWANSSVMDTLRNISDFSMYWLFHSKPLAKLASGPLLGDMVNHMQSYKKKDKTTKKAYIYSAHDTTVSGLLSVLGVFDRKQPPYSSAVLVELYSSHTGEDLSVQIFYRIGQSNKLQPIMIPGCNMDCPLDAFTRLTKSLIPEDRDAACGIKAGICIESIIYKGFLTAFAVTLVILVVLSICLCYCWCKRRSSSLNAARIDFDDAMLKDASLLNNQDYDSE